MLFENLLKLIICLLLLPHISYSTDCFPLHDACKYGDKEIVFEITRWVDLSYINTRNNEGQTPVCIACSKGNREIVKFLCDLGADLSIQNNQGWTPLHEACWGGYSDIVTMLCDYKVALDTCNKNGQTPLFLACYQGHEEIVQLLCDIGADCNSVDNKNWMPLHIACYKGHEEIVKILCCNGAFLNTLTNDGYTPLGIASFNMLSLLNAYADLPLSEVEKAENFHDIVDVLSSHGAAVEVEELSCFDNLVYAEKYSTLLRTIALNKEENYCRLHQEIMRFCNNDGFLVRTFFVHALLRNELFFTKLCEYHKNYREIINPCALNVYCKKRYQKCNPSLFEFKKSLWQIAYNKDVKIYFQN